MPLHVAIQMDDVATLDKDADNTLLLAREAFARGHKLFYYNPQLLSWSEGNIVARGSELLFSGGEIIIKQQQLINLQEMDVVLLRQNPPFDMRYLTTTYLLEQLMPEVLVINNPAAVRHFPEKIFPTLLEQYMPPTLISADIEEIKEFRSKFSDIIIKPLYSYGGKGVLRIKPDDNNFYSLLEMIFERNPDSLVVQYFIPEAASQERRIILLDGEIAGALGRIPAADDIRSNLRVGGKAVATSLSEKQQKICLEIGETLHEQGIIFAGLDMIGDYLNEINITSPTGMSVINSLYSTQLEKAFWNIVETYC